MFNLFFSASAAGNAHYLREALGINGETITSLTLSLSTGNITVPFSVSSRRDVYTSMFDLDSQVSSEMRYFKKALKNDNQVCIWYSAKDSNEYTGMLAAVSELNHRGCTLFICDCTDICVSIACLEEVKAAPSRRMLTSDEITSLGAEWRQLQNENASFRIMQNGRAISVPDDYMDETILSIIGDKEMQIAHVFSQFPWEECPVNVSNLTYRFRQLIQSGQLIAVQDGWVSEGVYGGPIKDFMKSVVKAAPERGI